MDRYVRSTLLASKASRILATIDECMARWPQRMWTTVFTYAAVFLLFPLLALLAYAFVNGLIF